MKYIIHLDGDAFFASCEIAQNERLRGKPVVTGEDRGIVTSATYEAKALGVSRGLTIRDVRKLYPQVTIASSSYDTYKIYSERMYAIVRRYTDKVEEYSVDECFADISGRNFVLKKSYEEIAKEIQETLKKDLGMSFSIGLAPTKVLAKVASKWNKPAGFAVILPENIHTFLEKIPVGKIWGIGPSTSAKLMSLGIKTALEFILKPEWWIKENLAEPLLEIWYELQGISVLSINDSSRHEYKSVMKTATFHPATNNKAILLSELAKNIEKACTRLRTYNLVARDMHFFIKTQQFSYHSCDIQLPMPLATPSEFIGHLEQNFHKIFNKNRLYRATGVVLRNLSSAKSIQQDLFGVSYHNLEISNIFTIVDGVGKKYGPHTLHLAKSFMARNPREFDNHARIHDRKNVYSKREKVIYEMSEKLGIPYWGETQ